MAKEMISVRVSATAATALKNYCAKQGISVTALIETIGLGLSDENTPLAIEYAKQHLVENARSIDRERRARKPAVKPAQSF